MYIQTIPNISYVDMSIPKNSKSSQCPELPLIRLVQPASAGDVGCQGPAVCSKIIASTAFTSKTTINVRYTPPKKKFCIGMYWVCSCLHIHFGRPDQEVFK